MRVILRLCYAALLLWGAAILLLHTPYVQQRILLAGQRFVEKSTHSTLKFSNWSFSPPLGISLHDVTLRRENDLLFSAEQVSVSLATLPILNAHIRELKIERGVVHAAAQWPLPEEIAPLIELQPFDLAAHGKWGWISQSNSGDAIFNFSTNPSSKAIFKWTMNTEQVISQAVLQMPVADAVWRLHIDAHASLTSSTPDAVSGTWIASPTNDSDTKIAGTFLSNISTNSHRITWSAQHTVGNAKGTLQVHGREHIVGRIEGTEEWFTSTPTPFTVNFSSRLSDKQLLTTLEVPLARWRDVVWKDLVGTFHLAWKGEFPEAETTVSWTEQGQASSAHAQFLWDKQRGISSARHLLWKSQGMEFASHQIDYDYRKQLWQGTLEGHLLLPSALGAMIPFSPLPEGLYTISTTFYPAPGDTQGSKGSLIGKDVRWRSFSSPSLRSEWQQGDLLKFSMELAPLRSTLPEWPIQANFAAQGTFKHDTPDPTLHLSLTMNDLEFPEYFLPSNHPLHSHLEVDLSSSGTWFRGDVLGLGAQPVHASGSLPIRLTSQSLGLRLNRGGPIDLQITGEGALEHYLPLIATPFDALTGHLKLAMNVRGSLEQPELQGLIELRSGAYESFDTGLRLQGIQGDIEGEGRNLVFKRWEATDGGGGRIAAHGTLSLNKNEGFPFLFTLFPSHLKMLNVDYAQIEAGGELRFRGNAHEQILEGELTVDQGLISLQETLPQHIQTIDVQTLHAPGSLPELLEETATPKAVALNIQVSAPHPVKIEDMHLVSAWKGGFTLGGDFDHLLLHGDLHLAHGEYELQGHQFALTQGTIHLGGPIDSKTTLYAVASREIGPIRAEILVKGAAQNPKISFRSFPPLPQREVLSYILFGRGLSDITSDEGAQLSQSFFSLSLSDQPQGTDDPLTRLRRHIGIDRLDFSTSSNLTQDPLHPNDTTEFGLQMGKYLSKDTYVSLNQRLNGLAPTLSITTKLKKHLAFEVDTDLGADSSVKASLQWKHDY